MEDSLVTTGNPFRYTGQRHDLATGLYYHRAQCYWRDIGRFQEADPMGYADQLNPYAYVGNNPLNATDPSGMVAAGTKGCVLEEIAIADWQQDVGCAAVGCASLTLGVEAALALEYEVYAGGIFLADTFLGKTIGGASYGTYVGAGGGDDNTCIGA